MSVTITIANNAEFLRSIDPDAIKLEVFECVCTDGAFGVKTDPDCLVCKGSGINGIELFPFELNLANGNFATFFAALGFSVDYCGSMNPGAILRALDVFDPALAMRGAYHRPAKDGFPEEIYFGTTTDQIGRYVDNLREIAAEAQRRGEYVTWY